MNLTEAYELILKAAGSRLLIDEYEEPRTGKRSFPDLEKAIRKIQPRVERMRARLDSTRARKAGKPTRPKWATP